MTPHFQKGLTTKRLLKPKLYNHNNFASCATQAKNRELKLMPKLSQKKRHVIVIESDKNNSQNCVLSCSSIPFLEQPQWHPKWHPKAIRIESLHYPKGIRKVSEMVSNHIILTPAAATAKIQHYPKSIRNGSEMTPSPSQKHAKRRDGKIM